MIAITTSNSISVNPFRRLRIGHLEHDEIEKCTVPMDHQKTGNDVWSNSLVSKGEEESLTVNCYCRRSARPVRIQSYRESSSQRENSFHSFHSLREAWAHSFENLVVVKRQFGQIVERKPPDRRRVVAGFGLQLVRSNVSQVRDGHGPSTRVTAGVAERVKLFEDQLVDAGFFHEFAASGVDQALVLVDESP